MFGIHNHFQGIAKKGDLILLTGGNKLKKEADLFSINLKSKIVQKNRINLSDELWHAGAFIIYKDDLIIPIERLSQPLTSKIIQFNLKTKKHSLLINKKTNKTGALDIFYLNNQKMLVLFDPREIGFYDFSSKKLISSHNMEFFKGSSAKVISDCNGKIFFLNFTNNGLFPPLLNKNNILELFEFTYNPFKLVHIKTYKYSCTYCNFRGAVNLQISEGGELSILSSSMYLNSSKQLFINEFK